MRGDNERRLFQTIAIALTTMLEVSCTSGLARQNVERVLDSYVGRIAESEFKGSSYVTCAINGTEKWCTDTSSKGCSILYIVNSATGRIASWRYAGPPEKCWSFSHKG